MPSEGRHTGVGGEVEGTFIYDVYYDMKKLKTLAGNLANPDTGLVVHRAFWSFLDIADGSGG